MTKLQTLLAEAISRLDDTELEHLEMELSRLLGRHDATKKVQLVHYLAEQASVQLDKRDLPFLDGPER